MDSNRIAEDYEGIEYVGARLQLKFENENKTRLIILHRRNKKY